MHTVQKYLFSHSLLFFGNTTNMLPMNISLQFTYLSSCCLIGCDTMHHPAACLGGNRAPQKCNWDRNMRLSALAQGDYHTLGSPSVPGGTFSQQLIKSRVSLTVPLLQLVTCVCAWSLGHLFHHHLLHVLNPLKYRTVQKSWFFFMVKEFTETCKNTIKQILSFCSSLSRELDI